MRGGPRPAAFPPARGTLRRMKLSKSLLQRMRAPVAAAVVVGCSSAAGPPPAVELSPEPDPSPATVSADPVVIDPVVYAQATEAARLERMDRGMATEASRRERRLAAVRASRARAVHPSTVHPRGVLIACGRG